MRPLTSSKLLSMSKNERKEYDDSCLMDQLEAILERCAEIKHVVKARREIKYLTPLTVRNDQDFLNYLRFRIELLQKEYDLTLKNHQEAVKEMTNG